MGSTLRVRLLVIMLGGLCGLTSAIAPTPTASAQTTPLAGIPVTGTAQSGGMVSGSFTITEFVVNSAGTGVDAVGTATGSIRQPGGLSQQVKQTAQLPVSIAGTCQNLHLALDPVELPLAGTPVQLGRAGLDIPSPSDPDNLLGHLLCRVPKLLDDPVGLADVLNQIDALNGR
jgi:hypothetical protein